MMTENDFIEFLKEMNGEAFLSSWLKEWELFKERKLNKKIKILSLQKLGYEKIYSIVVDSEIPIDKYDEIKIAIESVINGHSDLSGKIFTEEDMRKCFEAGKFTFDNALFFDGLIPKKKTFEDYIKSLNK